MMVEICFKILQVGMVYKGGGLDEIKTAECREPVDHAYNPRYLGG
jgi:hypothetical protein